MKRITSINNAIKYFRENTKTEVRKDSKGDKYMVYIAPRGFQCLRITENLSDNHGRITGSVTQLFSAFQWKDYASIISARREKIVKLELLYEP